MLFVFPTPVQWVIPCSQWTAGVKMCQLSPFQGMSSHYTILWDAMLKRGDVCIGINPGFAEPEPHERIPRAFKVDGIL